MLITEKNDTFSFFLFIIFRYVHGFNLPATVTIDNIPVQPSSWMPRSLWHAYAVSEDKNQRNYIIIDMFIIWGIEDIVCSDICFILEGFKHGPFPTLPVGKTNFLPRRKIVAWINIGIVRFPIWIFSINTISRYF